MSKNEAAARHASRPRSTEAALSVSGRGVGRALHLAYTVHMGGSGLHLAEARSLPPLELGWVEGEGGVAPTSSSSSSPTSPTSPTSTSSSASVSRETLTARPTRPTKQPSPYNPAELAKALLALLGLLLGLTLWLGGWQPTTSDARLGWSHGTISVTKGTDGDTGAHPLDPNDSGVLPADPGGRPVDLPKAYLGDSSRFAPGVSPWAGPVDA